MPDEPIETGDLAAESATADSGQESTPAPISGRERLKSAFVRTLSGTSSRMVENVNRWSIKL